MLEDMSKQAGNDTATLNLLETASHQLNETVLFVSLGSEILNVSEVMKTVKTDMGESQLFLAMLMKLL